MIASLLWKEWREQRWKAVGIFAVYGVLVITAYLTSRKEGFEAAQGCIFALEFLVPGFVAMGTITQERSRRTDETLRSLPAGRVELFACRFLGGVATMLIPLVAIQAICLMAQRGGDWRVDLRVLFAEMALMVMLYVWALALGARLRSEAALALVNIGLLCTCGFVSIFLDAMGSVRSDSLAETLRDILLQVLPTGFATLIRDFVPPQDLPVDSGVIAQCTILQGLEFVPLLLLAYWRMNLEPGTARRGAGRGIVAAQRLWVGRERRLPILWKTWREARLLVCGYAAVASCFMAGMGGTIWWSVSEWNRHSNQAEALAQASADMFVALPGVLSLLVVIVLGVDIGVRDFENRLENFWQSRPIGGGGYMAKRFLSGLLALVPVLLIVPATGLLYIPVTHLFFPGTWVFEGMVEWWKETPYGDYAYRVEADAMAFLAFYVPQALVIYGMSVLCATLTRRRVISLVMGIGCGLALQMLFAMEEMHHVTNLIKEGPGFTEVLVYAGIMAAVTALLGWLAVLSVKLDWRAWFERRVGAPEVREAVVKPLAAGG